jgi:hypothetical protein
MLENFELEIVYLSVSFMEVSFTLREEHKLRVFENTVLRRIFRPERGSGVRLQKTA